MKTRSAVRSLESVRRRMVPALLIVGAACGRGGGDASTAGGDVGGTLVAAMPAEPRVLLPMLAGQIPEKFVIDQVFESLAAIGPDLNTFGDAGFQPRLAERWTWAPDSLSIAFHLNPKARWHDGEPVRASDVRFTFELAKDARIRSNAVDQLSRIDSVSTPDSLTAVVWYTRRYAEQFYDATYDIWIVPEHALRTLERSAAGAASAPFNRNPIGSGRFRFVKWEPGARIELVADTANYRGRPHLDRIIWQVMTEPTTKAPQLGTNEIDVFDQLSKDQVAQVATQAGSRVQVWPGMTYGYVLFNGHERKSTTRPHPILGSRALREALAMSLDRAGLVRAMYDSLAVPSVGPMVRPQALADTTIPQPAFDTLRAAAILDSAGWRRSTPDGIRTRQGKPLRLGLLVPSVSAPRVRSATIVQEQWRRMGVQVDIEQVEPQVFGQRFMGRDFDLLFNAVSPDPSVGGVRGWWTAAAAAQMGSMNAGGWSEPAFDGHLDSALTASTLAAGRAHASKAYAALMGDIPAIWIFEPRNSIAINRRFRNVTVQGNGWWQNIAEWSIPASERLPRDRIGLTTTAAR